MADHLTTAIQLEPPDNGWQNFHDDELITTTEVVENMIKRSHLVHCI